MPKWSEEWLAAIDEAIRDWKKVRDEHPLSKGKPCMVCNVEQSCVNCPIFVSTGKPACENTPFVSWRLTLETNNIQTAVYYSNEQVKFLHSLRVRMLEENKKPEPEVFYHIGQRFSFPSGDFILAQIDYATIVFICLKKGNRKTTPVKVNGVHEITQAEFDEVKGIGMPTLLEQPYE